MHAVEPMSAAKPCRKRRSLASLTAALEKATTEGEEAHAHYNLALFHDNNGREAQAIPHYREALALDIDPAVVPETLAWLASSLHKTSQPTEASSTARRALHLTTDPSLKGFLVRLLRRIDKATGQLYTLANHHCIYDNIRQPARSHRTTQWESQ